MNIMTRFLLIFLIAIGLSGCVTSNTIQRSALASISPNMNIAQVKKKFTNIKPTSSVNIAKNGKKYLVERYELQIGTTQQTYMQCIPVGTSGAVTCYPVTTDVPVTEPYYLIYRGDKDNASLLTWESKGKLAASQNREAAGLHQAIQKEFTEIKKAKREKEKKGNESIY